METKNKINFEEIHALVHQFEVCVEYGWLTRDAVVRIYNEMQNMQQDEMVSESDSDEYEEVDDWNE